MTAGAEDYRCVKNEVYGIHVQPTLQPYYYDMRKWARADCESFFTIAVLQAFSGVLRDIHFPNRHATEAIAFGAIRLCAGAQT